MDFDDDDFILPEAVIQNDLEEVPQVISLNDAVASIVTAFHVAQASASCRKKKIAGPKRRVGRPWSATNLKLICCPVSEQDIAPTSAELPGLANQGLGVPCESDAGGKTSFPNGQTAGVFQEKLCELFPRLIPGQFDLCTASKGRKLNKVQDWRTKSVEEIRRTLKQSRVYILPSALRPLATPLLPQALPPSQDPAPTPPLPSSQDPAPAPPLPPSQDPAPAPPLPPAQDPAPATPLPPAQDPTPATPLAPAQDPAPAPPTDPQALPELQDQLPIVQTPRRQERRLNLRPEMESGTPTVILNPRTIDDDPFSLLVEKIRPIPQDESKILLNIGHGTLLKDAMQGFFRSGTDLRRPTHVRFKGMNGIDSGGLSRQFKMDLVRELQKSAIFGGPDNERRLVYNHTCVKDELYMMYATLMAYLIAHGGPYPTFFCRKLLSEVNGDRVQYAVEDIQESGIREKVMKLKEANEEEFDAALDAAEDVIELVGVHHLCQFHQKEQLVQSLVDFLCVERMREPLRQLKEGLSSLGVLDLVRRNPQTSRPFFLTTGNQAVSAEQLVDLWMTDIDLLSNHGQDEARVHGYFLDFIADLDEAQRKKLLVFATGQDVIPVLGFDPQPVLRFKTKGQEEDAFRTAFHNDVDMTPTANTCALELVLPIVDNMDIFRDMMMFAIDSSTEFTHA